MLLLIASQFHFMDGFFGCTNNTLPILYSVGMLIVAGDDYLGLKGQDLLAKDLYDPSGSCRKISPGLISSAPSMSQGANPKL